MGPTFHRWVASPDVVGGLRSEQGSRDWHDRLRGLAPAKAPCEKFDIAASVAWAELLVPSPVTV